MPSTELYLDTADHLVLAESASEMQIPSLPDWNRIHLDVFDSTGTF
jgi:hypothetical protein